MKVKRGLATLALALIGAGSARAEDCRRADVPPGVRGPDRPGCKPSSQIAGATKRARTVRENGFVEVGEGTQVRVSGRVRIESRGGR